MTFRLTMYPGMDGDCIVLSWGNPTDVHHMIVDLGRGKTYRAVKNELKKLGKVELFVMSHVDADHIAGAIPMVRESTAPFNPGMVWYNARPQLVSAEDRQPIVEPLSARQGEKLARGIVKFNWPWNSEFTSEIVSTDSAEARVSLSLPGDLQIRLLSPGDTELAALLPQWDAELEKAKIRTFDPDAEGADPLSPLFEPLSGAIDVQKLAGEEYKADDTKANGSSIAFLAEYEGKRVLLAADAHSEVLEASLAPLAEMEGGRYRIDLLKVSHHGSKSNTSKRLPQLIDCQRFAFSTNGDHHNHPDRQTVARFLVADTDRHKTLFFNYRQPSTDVWESQRLETRWNYECVIPVSQEDDPLNGTLVIDI